MTLMLSTGYLKSYIIMPSTIYGIATGKLVDIGVQNAYSIQMPFLIKASLARGQAGMVGEGKNIWPNVNIEESGLAIQHDVDHISLIGYFYQPLTCTLLSMTPSSLILPRAMDARVTILPKMASIHNTRPPKLFRK
jgi:hypothetical protein